ncbi:MAG: 2-phospho-L-lactate guanylyltransferase [Anaerolineae bacterium]|nr:2-phospho-L-lactate guanylyltransferase [Anaerolineae bacterium]
MATWAVIPVKSLAQTKSRLTAVLTATERAALTQFLLQRTIGVLRNSGVVDRVVVVSRDTAVQQLATAYDALTLAESPAAGLNGAIQEGARLAAVAHAARLLVLPTDLPFLTAADVQTVANDTPHQAVGICPDRHEQGTNGLLLPAQVDFPFQFGVESFQKHVLAARYGRFTLHMVRTPGWQFDLDTVEDWAIYSPKHEVAGTGQQVLAR